jgi:Na+/H+ antiporter NhaD/arsenite permease-like protein
MLLLPILILLLVLIFISIRTTFKRKIDIWKIMFLGALIVILTGQISLYNAYLSIQFNVIIFLFSMFVVGLALEKSNYLLNTSHLFLRYFKSKNTLLFGLIFITGFLSFFIVNDTLAVVTVSLAAYISSKHGIKLKPLLLVMAFSITLGSVMSPIGNPQNLLIASSGLSSPFLIFFRYLFIPTMLNLFIVYFIIKIFYGKSFKTKKILVHTREPILDNNLAKIVKISIAILFLTILFNVISSIINLGYQIGLVYIGIFSALPILLLSNRRVEIFKEVNWSILIFFVSMFILIQSVWLSGVIQPLLGQVYNNLASIPFIFGVSIILSQFISNLPLVALYIPILKNIGVSIIGFMALAAGSTIAGNVSILGAASNIIIINQAEKKYNETISMWEFVKIGIPLTIINALVYFLFLYIGL